ncbi:ATP-binding cassette sub-family C member 4-like [Sebastes fasciatus]|uniref:ATP-binding cassette sub-family C member 4-like n=1 Tax=Sebastes fasciatus TaxID=394691 RepID=UPI003D9DDFED
MCLFFFCWRWMPAPFVPVAGQAECRGGEPDDVSGERGGVLESEAPWETQKRPPPDWPSKGPVTFDPVSLSYGGDGPPVLQNLKAMFRLKEKVGIVG